MPMYDYQIQAAFEDARQDNYQHPTGIDPDMVARECAELLDAVDVMIPEVDPDELDLNSAAEEERQMTVAREAFVRAFEAGLRVGLEAGEEGVELRIHVDRATIGGLVQQALGQGARLKE